jgi:HEAT repeat protein
MESTILHMLEVPQLQNYAIEGLKNLKTPTAHRALANVVRTAPPGLDQNLAITYLGEIGDSGDVQLLLDAAHASAPGRYSRELALVSAAEVGGAKAVPKLAAELMDESNLNRQSAVRALYMTGSRAAVPVLIELTRISHRLVVDFGEWGV